MNKTIYLFFRHFGTFYLLELSDDLSAIAHARCNRGTVRVETFDGRLVWRLK